METSIAKDPYVTNDTVVESWEVKEFELKSSREFNSVANDFLYKA
jgi:hypothetical protein